MIRSFRIGGMAVFDWVLAILALFILLLITGNKILPSFIVSLIAAPTLGIYVHLLIGQPTMLNYYLGLSSRPQTKKTN